MRCCSSLISSRITHVLSGSPSNARSRHSIPSKAGGVNGGAILLQVRADVRRVIGFPQALSVQGATYAKFGPQGKAAGGWGYREDTGKFDVEDLATAFVR